MSTVTALGEYIGQRIDDPAHDEVVVATTMLGWINRVCADAAKLTDCLQSSSAIVGTGAESYAITGTEQGSIRILIPANLTNDTIVVGLLTGSTASSLTRTIVAQANATVMAANIAEQFDDLAGLTAYSDGAEVYFVARAGYSITSITAPLSTTTGATPDLTISYLSSSTLHRVLSVSDQTDGIVYRAVKRAEYHGYRARIITNAIAGDYIFNVFGFDSARKIYILPYLVAARSLTVECSHFATAITAVGNSPQGILDKCDELIISGVAKIYFDMVGDQNRSQYEFQQYMQYLNMLNNEVGINPEIKPEMSSLHSFVNTLYQEIGKRNK